MRPGPTSPRWKRWSTTRRTTRRLTKRCGPRTRSNPRRLAGTGRRERTILGRPTEVEWAVVFARVDDVPRHPVQLYEVAAYLSIFVGPWNLYRGLGSSLNGGVLSGLFLGGVFSSRVALEVFKVPQAAFAESLGMFSMGQWLSFPLIGLGTWLILRAGTSEQARLADA